jgi:predicted RNA-binding protein
MKQRALASILAAVLLAFFSNATFADAVSSDEDTDNRFVQAKIVEVAESHISVMARTGVEHVIAVDREGTKVTIDGQVVSLKEVREGDIATIDLDAHKQVKFAKNITLRSEQLQVARVRR